MVYVGGCLKEFFKGKKQNESDDLIGQSHRQIQITPMTSFWQWGENEESDAYQNNYFFGNRPISIESAVDQFMSWAGVSNDF